MFRAQNLRLTQAANFLPFTSDFSARKEFLQQDCMKIASQLLKLASNKYEYSIS